VDLVIWNEDHDVYRQRLAEQIIGLIAAVLKRMWSIVPGAFLFVHAEQISSEDRILFIRSPAQSLRQRREPVRQINRRISAEVRIPQHAHPHLSSQPSPAAESPGMI